MARPILIRGARQLLTLRGGAAPRRGLALRELGIIADGAVLICDGAIREVGPSRRVEALAEARDAEEISAAGQVVMPGFVDAHTHPVAGPSRAFDTARGDLEAWEYWKRVERMSSNALEAEGLEFLEECLRHGTTTIEAKSGFGIDERGEVKLLRAYAALNRRTGMVVSTFMGTRWLPAGVSSGEYIEWMCSHMLPLVRRRGLAEFADICCEDNMFSAEQAARYLRVARQLGLRFKMHVGQRSNTGAVADAVRLGAASVDHLVFVGERDAQCLAGSDTIAMLLPGPVFFKSRRRYAPARALIDAGAAVALATDYNPETSPCQNMQTMIALACREMSMTVAEAVSAATINGAHALCRAHRTGSLERGKRADIVILGVSDYREFAHHFGVNLVDVAIKSGEVIFQRSRVRWAAEE